jgi:SNF2 family DNA or RNA helicase
MDYLIKPWDHQLTCIERAKEMQDFALFFDMGAGKTSTTINILRHKFAHYKRVLRTVIFCPPVVCINWKREFEAHSKIGHLVHVLSGSQKKRIEQFNKLKDNRPSPIFVTNYESLQMEDLMQLIFNWRPEATVWDESQRIKNPQAKRTKIAIRLADLTLHNYILSGTPILNNAMDVWAQFRVLDRGQTFQDHRGKPMAFMHFRAKYFTDKNAGMPSDRHFPKFVLGEGMEDLFHDMIYAKAMRVMKSECLDLPPLVKTRVEVELAPEQKRLYNEMKEHFIAYLESGEAVTAQVAVTKALRLQQIVSGYCKTEDGVEIQLEHNPRLTALEETLEGLPENSKVIIWSVFQANYREIASVCEKLKLPYRELHGLVPGKDRQKNIDDFNNDPEVRVMIANQGAGGVGVNLIAASYSFFYSRNFSLEQDLQAEARNYRGGSEIHEKVTRVDFVAPGTIDEVIMEALANKVNLAESILALRNRI